MPKALKRNMRQLRGYNVTYMPPIPFQGTGVRQRALPVKYSRFETRPGSDLSRVRAVRYHVRLYPYQNPRIDLDGLEFTINLKPYQSHA